MNNSLPKSSDLFEGIQNELHAAQSELEEYRRLLDQLPGIYEDKFRHEVRAVANDIHYLLDERKALQEQLSRGLFRPRAPEALPPAAAVSVVPVRRSWSYLRLPRFQLPYNAIPSFGLPNRLQLGMIIGSGVALVLLVLGLPSLLNRRSLPLGGTPTVPLDSERSPLPTAAILRVKARGGQSWVLVERLGGGIVYDAILESGESKDLPLGSGLKIRSGRPDLLYVGVGITPAERLGAVDDLDWFEFRP